MTDQNPPENDQQARLDKWWANWWAADYSWGGLADKPWDGWSVTPENLIVETDDAPEGSRPATLQDYFRWDVTSQTLRDDSNLMGLGLLETHGTNADFHILHLPLHWQNGEATWKSDSSHHRWGIVEAELELRQGQSGETQFDDDSWLNVIGADSRAQFGGVIIKTLPRPPAPPVQKEQNQPDDTALLPTFYLKAHQMFVVDVLEVSGCRFDGFEASQSQFIGTANFLNTRFYSGTSFTSAQFHKDAYFFDALFHKEVDFSEAHFDTDAYFSDTQFHEKAYFTRVQFHADTHFYKALFHGETSFSWAQFHAFNSFSGAQFQAKAHFSAAQFNADADFAETQFGLLAMPASELGFSENTPLWYPEDHFAKFDETLFKKDMIATEATFNFPVSFHGSIFEGLARFGDAARRNGAKFLASVSFRAAHFKHLADFSKTVFSTKAEDRNSAFEGAHFHQSLDMKSVERLPFSAFHGAHLEKGVLIDHNHPADDQFQQALRETDEAAKRDKVKTSEDGYDRAKDADAPLRGMDGRFATLEGGCRVLKRAMAAEIDRQREQKFYRMELIARTHRTDENTWEKRASKAYGVFADYGASITRPLAWLGKFALGFAGLYLITAACLALAHPELVENFVWFAPFEPFHPIFIEPIELALKNMMGPLQFAITDHAPFGQMVQQAPLFRLILSGLSAAQSLISLILLFLTALALRRQFQIS